MIIEHPYCTIKKEVYEDGSIEYVAKAPHLTAVMGVGDTPKEALSELESAIEAYEKYKEDNKNAKLK